MPIYFQQPTVITIAFEELDGSPEERFTRNGFEATRRLKCAYADRITLAQQLRGNTAQTQALVVLTVGDRFADFPLAIVEDVSIKPFEGLSTGSPVGSKAVYQNAELTVTYRVPDGEESPSPDQNPADILVTENIEASAEFITIPKLDLFFDNQATQELEIDGARIIATLDWIYQLHQVPEIPPGTFDLIGSVNKDVMHSNKFNRNFEIETLLFNPPTTDPVVTSNGSKAWNITYRFTYKPFGWNKKVKPGEFAVDAAGNKLPKFVDIFDKDGNIYKFYEPKNLKDIVSS